MADIAAGVRRTIQLMATPGLAYRQGTSGSFVALSGDAILHPDRPDQLGWDDDDQSEEIPTTATLKATDAATALKVGWQVQQTVTLGGVSKTRTWSILGVSYHRGKVAYRMRRTVTAPGLSTKPRRGSAG